MQQRPLGRSGLTVPEICLGTMTWGRQNTEAEGHEQMDYALDQGLTFWDTAEMYAVPPTAESYGRTESIIGTWFASRGGRDRVLLASKIAGPARSMTWVRGRDGRHRMDADNLVEAVEHSLKRLQTEWLDLYQLHWPDRQVPKFGQLDYKPDPEETTAAILASLEDQLEAVDRLVRSGKIRHFGLSNETAWGTMAFLRLAEQRGWPRIVSVQNAFNLLNRTYEAGLSEISLREEVGLLAYSPLARGYLSGKYLDGQIPPGSSRAIDPRPSRYGTPRAVPATQAYVDLARAHGLDPCQMAIAWTLTRSFVCSTIIGATSMAHLRVNIAARDLTLPPEVLQAIDRIHQDNPNPSP